MQTHLDRLRDDLAEAERRVTLLRQMVNLWQQYDGVSTTIDTPAVRPARLRLPRLRYAKRRTARHNGSRQHNMPGAIRAAVEQALTKLTPADAFRVVDVQKHVKLKGVHYSSVLDELKRLEKAKAIARTAKPNISDGTKSKFYWKLA